MNPHTYGGNINTHQQLPHLSHNQAQTTSHTKYRYSKDTKIPFYFTVPSRRENPHRSSSPSRPVEILCTRCPVPPTIYTFFCRHFTVYQGIHFLFPPNNSKQSRPVSIVSHCGKPCFFTRHGTALTGFDCAPRNVYETPFLAGSGDLEIHFMRILGRH